MLVFIANGKELGCSLGVLLLLSVGIIDGIELGFSLGASLRDINDGAKLGTEVAPVVVLLVGDEVGSKDGNFVVGKNDGRMVGTDVMMVLVGDTDRRFVGDAVAATRTLILGLIYGEAVARIGAGVVTGLFVGEFDGLSVGDRVVGCNVGERVVGLKVGLGVGGGGEVVGDSVGALGSIKLKVLHKSSRHVSQTSRS